MIIYLYDGSFEGLLTSFYRAFRGNSEPDEIISKYEPTHPLASRKIEIETDPNKADKVYRGIKKRISNKAVKNVKYCYLSEEKRIGSKLHLYLQLGFKLGASLDDRLDEKPVLEIQQLTQKVGRERHRMLGLVRFREIKRGAYYAPIEPDYNIVSLIAPHFGARMKNQNWIIHDLKRDLAAIYDTEDWVLTEIPGNESPDYSDREEHYQDLWAKYFRSASVPGRKNKSLQRRYVPQRYWKHLVEMD